MISAAVLRVRNGKRRGRAPRRPAGAARQHPIRDSLGLAEESSCDAKQDFEQAERRFQRQTTPQSQGMTAIESLEGAEARRVDAQVDPMAAEPRVVAARQRMRRTEVLAPFDGVVGDRSVSAGDTTRAGKELVRAVDPSSMRFEVLVSADRLHELGICKVASVRINRCPDPTFKDNIEPIDDSASRGRRQAEILAGFAGPSSRA